MKTKLFIFSLFIIALSFKVYAQSSVSLNPGPIYTTNMGLNDWVYGGIEFTNITSDTLVMHYKKISKDTVQGTSFDVCLSGICFTGIPDSGIYSFPTPPGKIGWLRMHCWTGNISGTSKARIYLYDPAFPNNGDTLTYIINATSLSGTDDNIKNNFIAFPNPASDMLTIKNLTNVKEIRLVDIQGKIVKSYFTDMKDEYIIDLKEFSDGVYLIQYLDNDNVIIKTEKNIINK